MSVLLTLALGAVGIIAAWCAFVWWDNWRTEVARRALQEAINRRLGL